MSKDVIKLVLCSCVSKTVEFLLSLPFHYEYQCEIVELIAKLDPFGEVPIPEDNPMTEETLKLGATLFLTQDYLEMMH